MIGQGTIEKNLTIDGDNSFLRIDQAFPKLSSVSMQKQRKSICFSLFSGQFSVYSNETCRKKRQEHSQPLSPIIYPTHRPQVAVFIFII